MEPHGYKYSFSFSGAGWMMVYEFGVAKALQQCQIPQHARFVGTSAGALASVGLALGNDFDAMLETVADEYVPAAYSSLLGPFSVRHYLADGFTRHGNLHRFHILNEQPGKATIVYSSLSALKPRRKTTGFHSADHLMQTLLASCCAPPIVGFPFRLDGELVMDGGVFDNQPRFEDDPQGANTIRVNPSFFSDADIKPSQYFPPWWTMFPPSQQDMRWAFDLGYADGLQWAASKDLAPTKPETAKKSVEPLRWRTTSGEKTGYRVLDDDLDQVVLLIWLLVCRVCIATLQGLQSTATQRVVEKPLAACVVGLGTSVIVTMSCL